MDFCGENFQTNPILAKTETFSKPTLELLHNSGRWKMPSCKSNETHIQDNLVLEIIVIARFFQGCKTQKTLEHWNRMMGKTNNNEDLFKTND